MATRRRVTADSTAGYSLDEIAMTRQVFAYLHGRWNGDRVKMRNWTIELR